MIPPRHLCVVLGLMLSLPSLRATEPAATEPAATEPIAAEPTSPSPGQADWEKGQEAMLNGRNREAIASFKTSLQHDAGLVQNHLSLAAAYLAESEEEQAAEQLGKYLEARPEHYVVRGQYAELLLRLDRLDAARDQLERFEADLQEHETSALPHLVRCHTRLLDIAQRLDDEYGKHLHRGIALYWLARQRGEVEDGSEELSSEGLLCQSASELVLARRVQPDAARPALYLHEVWTQLAKRQPASRWLHAAEEAAAFSYLTPAEQRRLHLARRRQSENGSHK